MLSECACCTTQRIDPEREAEIKRASLRGLSGKILGRVVSLQERLEGDLSDELKDHINEEIVFLLDALEKL